MNCDLCNRPKEYVHMILCLCCDDMMQRVFAAHIRMTEVELCEADRLEAANAAAGRNVAASETW